MTDPLGSGTLTLPAEGHIPFLGLGAGNDRPPRFALANTPYPDWQQALSPGVFSVAIHLQGAASGTVANSPLPQGGVSINGTDRAFADLPIYAPLRTCGRNAVDVFRAAMASAGPLPPEPVPGMGTRQRWQLPGHALALATHVRTAGGQVDGAIARGIGTELLSTIGLELTREHENLVATRLARGYEQLFAALAGIKERRMYDGMGTHAAGHVLNEEVKQRRITQFRRDWTTLGEIFGRSPVDVGAAGLTPAHLALPGQPGVELPQWSRPERDDGPQRGTRRPTLGF